MEKSKQTGVLITDDFSIHKNILHFLKPQDTFQVIGETDNCQHTFQLILTIKPDFCLIDMDMPQLDTIQTIEQIKRDSVDTHVFVLSKKHQRRSVLDALHAGASGYLLKHTLPTELETALSAIVSGQIYISPAIPGIVVYEYATHHLSLDDELDLVSGLATK